MLRVAAQQRGISDRCGFWKLQALVQGTSVKPRLPPAEKQKAISQGLFPSSSPCFALSLKQIKSDLKMEV